MKRGDIVARKSYNKDIIFVVDKIIKNSKGNATAILSGLVIRIKVDAPIDDLVLVSKEEKEREINRLDKTIKNRVNNVKKIKNYKKISNREYKRNNVYIGKILHLDGDRRYSEKSMKYYRELGLNAVVRNIAENQQPYVVRRLLERYKPDILIVTGHDSMIKNGSDYNNIYNYRNSRHFINTVKEARKWGSNSDKLVIFAGACQSYFEDIMLAGADFASSPGRILIDFIDPLIVAEKVATTENYKYVTEKQIIDEIKEGREGIGGVGVKGKKRIIV